MHIQITPRLLLHLQVSETSGARVALPNNHTIIVIGGGLHSDGVGVEAHLASSLSRVEISTIIPNQ